MEGLAGDEIRLPTPVLTNGVRVKFYVITMPHLVLVIKLDVIISIFS